jgi:hypothetical protein
LTTISEMLGFLRVLPVPVTAIDEGTCFAAGLSPRRHIRFADCRYDEA